MEEDQKDDGQNLKKLEWLENPDPSELVIPSFSQEYGDLTELNEERLILDSVGKELLAEINGNNILSMGTSGAIYEKNGDYASKIFCSGWCRLMDCASRKLCPKDDKEALQSGQWFCRESCRESAKKAMATKGPCDLTCQGELRVFAVPIFLEGKVIGAIDFGHTEPPQDPEKIKTLSKRLKISEEVLYKNAKEYRYRPPYMFEIAKKNLQMNANRIGEIVARKRMEDILQQKNTELNEFATVVSHDKELQYQKLIENEKTRVEQLLRLTLPEPIIEEFEQNKTISPKLYDNVGILFCDVVDFTCYCDQHTPQDVFNALQKQVGAFEEIALKNNIQKIKTNGDSFICASGLMIPSQNPVLDCVKCGLEMVAVAPSLNLDWEVRVGIHVGPAMAGIVGVRQYLFDVWGDTVNIAARFAEQGSIGSVTLSHEASDQISDHYNFFSLGRFPVKGKGNMELFRITSSK